MAEAQLSVELSARIDGLRDGFNAAIKETGKWDKETRARLSAIDKGFADLANSVETNTSSKLSGSIKRTSSSVSKDLANMANASAKAGQGIAAGSRGAAQALTDLGRIASDAPYGFIGIQNNITPLVESFGRLKAESGSTATALKSLAGGLIGPAGLGLAFSVVSAGILLYTQYQQKQNKVVKESKAASDDYINTLDQLSQVQLKGAENALKEQTELATLYSITQNATLSTKQRLDAVNSLQDKYPSYFKNIKDENFLNGEAKNAYDDLTTSILATARARAAQDLITKNSTRQLENESKITRLRVEQQKALNKEREAAKLNNSANENITAGSTGNITTSKALNDATNVRLALDKQIYDLTTDTNKLTDNNLQLTKSVNTEIAKGADLTGKIGAVDTNRAKDVRTLSDVLKDLNIDLVQANGNILGTFGDRTKEKVNAYQKAIDELIKLGFKPANAAILKLKADQKDLFNKDAMGGSLLGDPGMPQIASLNPGAEPIKFNATIDATPTIIGKTELDKALEDLEAKKDQFLSLGNAFSLTSEALSGGFEAIGQSLASGGNAIEAFGQVVINAFGSFLAELGQMTIKEGIFHAAKGAALLFNPATTAQGILELKTGAGLIAAGGLLSVGGGALGSAGNSRNGGSTVQQPTAFANGGIIYGPTLGLMGEYAGAKSDPEVVAPLSKLKSILGQSEDSTLSTASSMGVNGGNVFNSTTNSYGTNGNNQPNIVVQAPEPIIMTSRFEISGEKLLVITERAKKRLNRVS